MLQDCIMHRFPAWLFCLGWQNGFMIACSCWHDVKCKTASCLWEWTFLMRRVFGNAGETQQQRNKCRPFSTVLKLWRPQFLLKKYYECVWPCCEVLEKQYRTPVQHSDHETATVTKQLRENWNNLITLRTCLSHMRSAISSVFPKNKWCGNSGCLFISREASFRINGYVKSHNSI
jgi:hypothetical protein